MKTISITLFTLFSIILISLPASAYWPVNLYDFLPVAADPDSTERNCVAIPYPDGGILVAFCKGNIGQCYQIIDRYGELKYEDNNRLIPNLPYAGMGAQKLLEDGEGGVFVAFVSYPLNGIYAQRLDSLGNRLWGDEGVQIYPVEESDIAICLDGEGGFFLSLSVDVGSNGQDLFAQRIDRNGRILWGPRGVVVSGTPNVEERCPEVTSDGEGGVFIVWKDFRPPHWPYGALYAQHLDSEGNRLWVEDRYICLWAYNFSLIPDGEGGFILQANPGGHDYYTHWRIDGDGDILWTRVRLGWYSQSSKMVPGEPGFFYLGFGVWDGYYGQRVDMDGNHYWPGWPEYYGAQFGYQYYMVRVDENDFYYEYPYFYAVFYFTENNLFDYLYINYLDSLGNAMLGDYGVQVFASYTVNNTCQTSVAPTDSGGAATVFRYTITSNPARYDVYAKHVKADGTLGGPNSPIGEVTIRIVDDNVMLQWPSRALFANYYIRKSLNFNNFPLEPDTMVQDTFFIDTDILGDDAIFYDVRWEPREW